MHEFLTSSLIPYFLGLAIGTIIWPLAEWSVKS